MDAANPSHALAQVLLDELARCGVGEVVLAPGSRSAALAIAAHDDPRLRLHIELDERSAGFLAVGLARGSGRPAAVIVTSGSAVANLHPAVVEAETGHVPVVLLTADRPPELRHTGANQAIEQQGIFGRSPRWQADLGVAEDRASSVVLWRSSVGRAVAAALGDGLAPPGPVHLNLPFREPTVPLSDDGRSSAPVVSAPLQGRPERRPWVHTTLAPRRLEDEELRGLAGRLLATERGLIVVGASTPLGGVTEAADTIHELSRATGWPVIAEPSSGVRTDPATTLAHAPLLLGDAEVARWGTPDLVLRIGRTALSRELAGVLGAHVPQLLLGGWGAWDDPERVIGERLVADVEATCAALAVSLGLPTTSAWGERWRALDAAAALAIDRVLDASDTPSEPRTARDLVAVLPAGATLVVASSMPIRDVDRFARPRAGLRVLANRGASGIDGHVSTVLGVALAAGLDARSAASVPTSASGSGSAPVPRGGAGSLHGAGRDGVDERRGAHGGDGPGRVPGDGRGRVPGDSPGGGPVVALTGDLSLLHDANGFHLAPDAPGVDATFVVVDNDGGGIFSFLPQASFPGSFERVFGTPHGRDLERLAAFHHLGYRRVSSAAELPAAVGAAIEDGGIQLVHVSTDRASNLALHRELATAVHDAVRGV